MQAIRLLGQPKMAKLQSSESYTRTPVKSARTPFPWVALPTCDSAQSPHFSFFQPCMARRRFHSRGSDCP